MCPLSTDFSRCASLMSTNMVAFLLLNKHRKVHTHTYAHTHIHTHTYTRTYIHTHLRSTKSAMFEFWHLCYQYMELYVPSLACRLDEFLLTPCTLCLAFLFLQGVEFSELVSSYEWLERMAITYGRYALDYRPDSSSITVTLSLSEGGGFHW